LTVDEFNDFCDRLEMTAEWGGQTEVFQFTQLILFIIDIVIFISVLVLLLAP